MDIRNHDSVCVAPTASGCEYDDQEIKYDGGLYNEPCVEKEMGIHRRKIRSLHGRDFHGKSPLNALDDLSPSSIFASCLEMREEHVIDKIMEGCTSIDEVIKKLKEQTISLTKKRCIKTRLTPVNQSKILQLSFIKKLKYRMSMSLTKLKIGCRNFLCTYELWYSSLKVIEGKFGSSVATYFKFLRKLFILNSVIFLLNLFFIIIPQLLYTEFQHCDLKYLPGGNISFLNPSISSDSVNEASDYSSNDFDDDFFINKNHSDHYNSSLRLGNFFTGMGQLSDSILFYGHYVNSTFSLRAGYTYNVPSAYFFSTAFCFFIVLCVLFFSVAESYKKCYIQTSNGIQNVFSEKIFCAWDFGITKPDAEELKYSNIYMELKELLSESKSKKECTSVFDSFHTLIIRVSLNLILLLLLIGLGWYTSVYLNLHMDNADVPTIMMLMLILTVVATIAPVIFNWLAKIEYYDGPRSALYATLIRTFSLHIVIITIIVVRRLNSSSKIACWETVLGQDIYRLVVLDFIVGVADIMVEFIRCRMNRRWKKIIRPEFNVARNSLNLIYNQTLLYIGLYFSPGLSLVVALKMLLTFYIRKWGAMYNCQPCKNPWRAAQTKTVFLGFAFLAFFVIMIAYGYVFMSVKTSMCGPFGGGKLVFQAVLYEILKDAFDYTAVRLLSQFFRTGVVVILLLLMMLAIYYLRTVISVRKRIVKNLRHIIKEQAAHKKKLLTRIHKAQTDFRIESKRNSDRRREQPSVGTKSCHVCEEGDESSDSDRVTEDFPLKYGTDKLHSVNNGAPTVRNRLSKSTQYLNINEANYSKKLQSHASLQNLRPCFYQSGPISNSQNFPPKDYSKINKSAASIQYQEDVTNQMTDSVESCKNLSDPVIETYNVEEALELMPVTVQNDPPCVSKRSYNYDERVPSRIYFGHSVTGRR